MESSSNSGGHVDPRYTARQASAEIQRFQLPTSTPKMSLDAARPQTPKLRKKRSKPEMRAASQPQLKQQSDLGESSTRYSGALSSAPSGGADSGAGKRKSSLRSVVRRLFGRRSKELESQQASPARHAYHKSDPINLSPPQEHGETSPEAVPQRTLSAPLQFPPSPSLRRIRSPYAVEFPQSARLKPLNLGNPFQAPGQLRRRKTLPSLLVADSDAAKIAASIESGDVPPVPSLGSSKAMLTPEVGTASGLVRSKRRSRSADDMKRIALSRSPPRKRSDEIRHWRQSYQGSVLRTSTYDFVAAMGTEPEKEAEDDSTSQVRVDTVTSSTSVPRPRTGSGTQTLEYGPPASDADVGSPSAVGTELSRDLEDRVAKLESGLQNFQRSLQKLTAQNHRKTVIVGDVPSRRSDGRTASMLADTLQGPQVQSQYRYQFAPAGAAPEVSPQTPVREPEVASAAVPADERRRTPSPQAAPQHTYRSLYTLLSEERSARRRLEAQVRNMRVDMSDMQDQLTRSGMSSTISSMSPPLLEPQPRYTSRFGEAGGSRFLAELAEDAPSSPPQGITVAGAQPGPEAQLVTSRFSGSESYVSSEGVEEQAEEVTTPRELYQTPREGRSRPFFGPSPTEEGGMF